MSLVIKDAYAMMKIFCTYMEMMGIDVFFFAKHTLYI